MLYTFLVTGTVSVDIPTEEVRNNRCIELYGCGEDRASSAICEMNFGNLENIDWKLIQIDK